MKTQKKQMAPVSALDYWVRHGRAHCTKMALSAGTTYDYWKRICNQRTRPSVDLARRLVALSSGEMSVDLLCLPREQIRSVGSPPLPGGYPVGALPKRGAVARSAPSAGVPA